MENVCRICLSNSGEHHIFESDQDVFGIFLKIQKCLNEKLEDIVGYPRKICNECNDMLNFVSEFIDKYRRSCEILNSGLTLENPFVKKEVNTVEDEKLDAMFYLDNTQGAINNYIDRSSVLNDSFYQEKKSKKTFKNVFKKSKCKGFTANGVVHKKKIKKEKDLTKKFKSKAGHASKLCDLCGSVFEKIEKLNEHIRRVHANVKFKCSKCSKIFSSSSGRNRHFKNMHSNLKDFMCAVCNEGFPTKTQVKIHIQKVHDKTFHKKVKKFTCKLCKKCFFGNKWLTIHERSAHTGERPAICDVCGADFYHEDYLKEHMRLHTGEAPFKCLVCGKGHAQRGNMKSHLRVHTLSELDPEVLKNLKPNMFKYFKKG